MASNDNVVPENIENRAENNVIPPYNPNFGESYKKTIICGPKSPNARLPKLFTPLTIRGVEFKNRIMVSPM